LVKTLNPASRVFILSKLLESCFTRSVIHPSFAQAAAAGGCSQPATSWLLLQMMAATVMLLLLCPPSAVGTVGGGGAAVGDAAPTLAPPFNSTWFRSYSAKTNLSVVPAVVGEHPQLLRWETPEHFSAIFSYLRKPLPLAKDGDKVNISMLWRSSGDNVCPASCYAHGAYCQSKECQQAKCVSKSVNCLGGTGDFRIALLDTSEAKGAPLSGDNWCPAGVGYGDTTKCITEEPFEKMRGYDFRIFPHLTKDAKHEPGQVPCSIYRKSSPNLFGKSPRLGEWGCFGTPLGKFTTLSLVIERKSKDELKLSMTMNGVTREAEDKVKSTDKTVPKQVDAIAIGYPNGRHYTYVELGATTAV
jgi:hypothetical protein